VPYGVDPVFKRGTQLFNPDFDDAQEELVQKFYNCSALPNPTYVISTSEAQSNNEPPFCIELFSSQGLPYAFYNHNLTERVSHTQTHSSHFEWRW